jgi:hypothetical protein
MKTMNDAVKEKLGQLLLTICEAEVAIAQRDERIAELEAELVSLNQSKAEDVPQKPSSA